MTQIKKSRSKAIYHEGHEEHEGKDQNVTQRKHKDNKGIIVLCRERGHVPARLWKSWF